MPTWLQILPLWHPEVVIMVVMVIVVAAVAVAAAAVAAAAAAMAAVDVGGPHCPTHPTTMTDESLCSRRNW